MRPIFLNPRFRIARDYSFFFSTRISHGPSRLGTRFIRFLATHKQIDTLSADRTDYLNSWQHGT